MGVGASMSISLTSNDELWGLVACHHYAPLHLSWSQLRFCELLGGTISALLQSLENTIKLRQSIRAEKTAFEIEREARTGKPLRDVILDHSEMLMDLSMSQGLSLILANERCRSRLGADDRAEGYLALKEALVEGIATSDQLAGQGVGGTGEPDIVSGAAMMELSDDGQDCLVLFRKVLRADDPLGRQARKGRYASTTADRSACLRAGRSRCGARSGAVAACRSPRRTAKFCGSPAAPCSR